MTNATIEQPAVYGALAKILAELGVAKGGTLPSNMGGKPYITAVDVAREVKTLFVANHLIFVPNESIFKHETVTHKDRINVLISITGEYTIISTEDGSSVTVSGTGDGLAGGTAVASNIASTNALKNALLRTFLITEQSVEDEAKNGPSTADAKEAPKTTSQARADKARQATAPAGAQDLEALKGKVRAWIGTDEPRRNLINEQMGSLKAAGKSGIELQKALVAFTEAQA